MKLEHPIETERLIVRRFVPEDWRDLYAYLSDERVVRYERYGPFSREAAQREAARRAESDEFLAVCLKESGKLIGNLYLGVREYETLELGYVFNAAYWHQGYAVESARAAIDYAFANGATRRIVAMCNPKNTSSWHLMERLHMRREGHLRQSIYFEVDENQRPIWIDTFVYAVLASEWGK